MSANGGGGGGFALAGAGAFALLVGLVVLEKSWDARAARAEEFLPRPKTFVRDFTVSEDTFDVAHPSIKAGFVKGLRDRDWALLMKGLTPDFRAKFPAPDSGVAVPDRTVAIRQYGGEALPEFDREGFVGVLRSHVESWAAVERTTWRPFEFLLDPGMKAAYASVHFQVAGRKVDGTRADLSGTVRAGFVTADGKEWKLRRLEWVEGARLDATAAPWADITDETGLHFNESAESARIRAEAIDGRAVSDSGSLVVADVNRDGFWDVLASGERSETVLFLNDGQGGFVRGEAPMGHAAGLGVTHVFVDLDNDGVEEWVGGDLTGYVDGRVRAPVWRMRDGAWEAVPGAIEAPCPPGLRDVKVEGIVPCDVDGNGFLDLFFCCYGHRDSKADRFNRLDARDGAHNYLWMNHGGMRFTEESDARGITGTQYTYVAKFWDFDFDGDPDLFEGNDYGPNHLYENDGKGRFRDRADHVFNADSNYTMGVTVADWDNTGTWSMYISNMYSHAGNRIMPLATGINEEMRRLSLVLARGNQMYEYDRASKAWRETAVERRVSWADWSWASLFFDLENDGDRDLFVSDGYTTNRDPKAPDW
ncbi:MAG: VCBS repeat-containing protein [Planctomycetes bacterium]|nr:VCBS repeat-containing protein [Planctomycetota bacterium]